MEQQKWKLLIVDDEPAMAWFLADIAESEGYEIEIAESGDEGVSKIEQGGYHAVLTDYRMPGQNGLDLIRFTREHYPDIPLVMITGYATVENTIEAFHLGVFDLLEKPFDLAIGRALLQRLRETLERQQRLLSRLTHLRQTNDALPVIISESGAMQRSLRIAKTLSAHPDPLLIYGERGCGRTTLARWVHQWSSEVALPLLQIECSAFNLQELEQLLHEAANAEKQPQPQQQLLNHSVQPHTHSFH
ncbi:MAG: sigma-54-dependent Fis family transcriptional regulator [Gammaproteobacteria bacterium]|nr:sigma-54-dependent Fis family transcriptional regulator [Gammaproteobacteria bacterium]